MLSDAFTILEVPNWCLSVLDSKMHTIQQNYQNIPNHTVVYYLGSTS